ncbi:MAG TPA: acetyl-CoA carboxylase carboxyl transferase subunit alpha, partial [Gammaproteobacteria bacterium]|nr:acetyl-CoA carboxylase carboxyl transferase subunit alpha [Gammaproteobacteria bacterium]
RAEEAAAAMGITSDRVLELGLIDTVIEEPLGGAHRDPVLMAERLKSFLIQSLDELQTFDRARLIERRRERLMGYGPYRES